MRGLWIGLWLLFVSVPAGAEQGSGLGGDREVDRSTMMHLAQDPEGAASLRQTLLMALQHRHLLPPEAEIGYYADHLAMKITDDDEITITAPVFGRFVLMVRHQGGDLQGAVDAIGGIEWENAFEVIEVPVIEVPPAPEEWEREVGPDDGRIDILVDRMNWHDEAEARDAAQAVLEAMGRLRLILGYLGLDGSPTGLSMQFPPNGVHDHSQPGSPLIPGHHWIPDNVPGDQRVSGIAEFTIDIPVWIDGRESSSYTNKWEGMSNEFDWAVYGVRRLLTHETWHNVQSQAYYEHTGGESSGWNRVDAQGNPSTQDAYLDDPWEWEAWDFQEQLITLVYPEGEQGHRDAAHPKRAEYPDLPAEYGPDDWAGVPRGEIKAELTRMLGEHLDVMESYWDTVQNPDGTPYLPRHLDYLRQQHARLQGELIQEWIDENAEDIDEEHRRPAVHRFARLKLEPYEWRELAAVFPEIIPGLTRVQIQGNQHHHVTAQAHYNAYSVTPQGDVATPATGGQVTADRMEYSPWGRFPAGAFVHHTVSSANPVGQTFTQDRFDELVASADDRTTRTVRMEVRGQSPEWDEWDTYPLHLRDESLEVLGNSRQTTVYTWRIGRQQHEGEVVAWFDTATGNIVQMTHREGSADARFVLVAENVPMDAAGLTFLCNQLRFEGKEHGRDVTKDYWIDPAVPGGLVKAEIEMTIMPGRSSKTTLLLADFGTEAAED
jgi:hypothetical protein